MFTANVWVKQREKQCQRMQLNRFIVWATIQRVTKKQISSPQREATQIPCKMVGHCSHCTTRKRVASKQHCHNCYQRKFWLILKKCYIQVKLCSKVHLDESFCSILPVPGLYEKRWLVKRLIVSSNQMHGSQKANVLLHQLIGWDKN